MAKYRCEKEVRGPEGTLLCVPGKVYDLFVSADVASALCEDGEPHMLPYSVVEENFSPSHAYIVVVIVDRAVEKFYYVDDLGEAVQVANECLDQKLSAIAHIKSGGIEHYANLEGIVFKRATKSRQCASYSGLCSWDAHILAL